MNVTELKDALLDAVTEYVEMPESWEDAQIAIDPAGEGSVEIVEVEEADELPDSVSVYPVMDLVEMTPDGNWIPDESAIAEVAESEIPE